MRTRALLRRLKARGLRFAGTARPILVLGLRRGGSTMVSDAVIANRGVWFANEPYAILPAHPAYETKRRLVPPPRHSHFFDLDAAAEAPFARYTSMLLSARPADVGTCRRARFPLTADRVCLKILNATWMIDWFAARTDAHLLTVLRHPGAQALSVMDRGWGYPVEAYLERPETLERAFSPAQIDRLRSAAASGDPWETALADWIVTSHPLRRMGPETVLRWRYEDIVLDPGRFVREVLAGRFDLAEAAAMRAALLRPSGSSRLSTAEAKAAIDRRDAGRMVNGWWARTDADMRARGQAMLDAFEVGAYRFDAPMDLAPLAGAPPDAPV
jgi:hypothetical protein